MKFKKTSEIYEEIADKVFDNLYDKYINPDILPILVLPKEIRNNIPVGKCITRKIMGGEFALYFNTAFSYYSLRDPNGNYISKQRIEWK